MPKFLKTPLGWLVLVFAAGVGITEYSAFHQMLGHGNGSEFGQAVLLLPVLVILGVITIIWWFIKIASAMFYRASNKAAAFGAAADAAVGAIDRHNANKPRLEIPTPETRFHGPT